MVETEQALATLNESLGAQGYPYKLALVNPKDIKELDKNAHFMAQEMFKNLVENVRRDGGLASVPFCWLDQGVYHVLSGNHRVKAARAANLPLILVLYTDRPLTRQERIAVQLSHNSINGRDDPTVLRELWNEIDDLGLKFYSGLDDKVLKQLAATALKSMNEAVLEYQSISVLFLPEEVERFHAAFEKAAASTVCDESWLLPARVFAKLIDTLDKTKASFKVLNNAVALCIVLDLFERHVEDLAEGYVPAAGEEKPKHTGQVPIASIFGTDKMPARVALSLRRLHDRLLAEGKVTKKEPWKTLELLMQAHL